MTFDSIDWKGIKVKDLIKLLQTLDGEYYVGPNAVNNLLVFDKKYDRDVCYIDLLFDGEFFGFLEYEDTNT